MTWQSVAYFLLWAAGFALMMRFGCGARIMGRSHRHDDAQRDDSARGRAVDPVCGMEVETSAAKSALYRNRAVYFCSTSCRDKFESEPAKFAIAQRGAANHGDHRHGHC